MLMNPNLPLLWLFLIHYSFITDELGNSVTKQRKSGLGLEDPDLKTKSAWCL